MSGEKLSTQEIARRARQASFALAASSAQVRDGALLAVADALQDGKEAIFAANAQDLEAAKAEGLSAPALKRLKFWLQRYGDSVIIFGISENTVEFGRSLIASGVHNVIYVGSKPDATCEAAINAAGALVR